MTYLLEVILDNLRYSKDDVGSSIFSSKGMQKRNEGNGDMPFLHSPYKKNGEHNEHSL